MQKITFTVDTQINSKAWQMVDQMRRWHDITSVTVTKSATPRGIDFILTTKPLNEISLRFLSRDIDCVINGKSWIKK